MLYVLWMALSGPGVQRALLLPHLLLLLLRHRMSFIKMKYPWEGRRIFGSTTNNFSIPLFVFPVPSRPVLHLLLLHIIRSDLILWQSDIQPSSLCVFSFFPSLFSFSGSTNTSSQIYRNRSNFQGIKFTGRSCLLPVCQFVLVSCYSLRQRQLIDWNMWCN